LLFLEKRAWLTRRRFHFPRRRVAGISLLLDAIFLAVSARSDRTDGGGGRICAASLRNGNWRVARIARSTRVYLRILSCHAIRRRCINRLSISECIPNFIEIHRRLAYLASCCYSTIICVFSKERQCLLVFSVRAFT